jgi:putative transposase
MQRTFLYKLRPTRGQEFLLAQTLETCRHLYNDCLAERKQAWKERQESVCFAVQCASLPERKQKSDFLPRVHSQVLQDVLHRVERSYQNFFGRLREKKEKACFPRFKGAGWYDSFTYRQWGNGAKFIDGRLFLSKIGSLKVCADRPLEGTPKTCTIRRRADGWYACVVCEVEPSPLPPTGESVGIDVGLESFATLSNAEQIDNPHFLRKAERKLKTAQRRLSRRQKGSHRRRKARHLLAKAHLKVQRARLDFAHKLAHQLVSRYDRITVEKLNIRGMLRNHPLAKSIADAGWGTFLSVLRAKAERAARAVVEVDPCYTSQTCSGCGESVPKRLSIRWHSCPYCGLETHRDVNAALNIRKKGEDIAFVEPVARASG